jgi:hypothetical protein
MLVPTATSRATLKTVQQGIQPIRAGGVLESRAKFYRETETGIGAPELGEEAAWKEATEAAKIKSQRSAMMATQMKGLSEFLATSPLSKINQDWYMAKFEKLVRYNGMKPKAAAYQILDDTGKWAHFGHKMQWASQFRTAGAVEPNLLYDPDFDRIRRQRMAGLRPPQQTEAMPLTAADIAEMNALGYKISRNTDATNRLADAQERANGRRAVPNPNRNN